MSSDPNMDGGDLSPTGTGPANSKGRKRTKTGCLTCRKRRIKCGEERPTCANCIKSKRQCEGYNQRVVFKAPMGEWPNHPGVVSTLQYHNSNLPGSRTNSDQQGHQPSQLHDGGGLAAIQPRPLTQFEYASDEGAGLGHQTQPYAQPLQSPHHYQQPLASPHHQIPTPTSATSYFPQPSPSQATFQGSYGPGAGFREQPYPQAQYPVSYDGPVDSKPTTSQAAHQAYYHQQSVSNPSEHQRLYAPRVSVSSQGGGYPAQVSSMDYSLAGAYTMPMAISHTSTAHSTTYPPTQLSQNTTSDVNYMQQHAVYGMSRV